MATENNNQSNSLMKHTKVQLIDIIFRKDEVEQTLRSELKKSAKIIDDNVTEIEELKDATDKINVRFNILRNEYHSVCDNFIDMKTKYDDCKKVCRITFIFLVIAICIIIANLFCCF